MDMMNSQKNSKNVALSALRRQGPSNFLKVWTPAGVTTLERCYMTHIKFGYKRGMAAI